MQRKTTSDWYSTDLFFPFVVLGLLLWFTYVFLIEVPYAGFYFTPTRGEVLEVYVDVGQAGPLKKGDLIEAVNNISWDGYKKDATQEFFSGVQKGQVVPMSINRNGKSLTVLWPFPGFNLKEFLARFVNLWWLGYIFWFFGFLTQYLIHPKDDRWWLMIAANYLTGLWLVCGTLSSSHVGMSLLVLRAVTWLIMPVYLNLHWDFPLPIFRIPRVAWILFYVAGFALALIELLQLFPTSHYQLAFLLTLTVSIILLIAHFIWQPAQRRDIGLLALFLMLALVPSIGLVILYTLNAVPQIGPLTLLALPIMPGAYFFVIYRRQLGGLEFRANRIMIVYSYLILLGVALLFLMAPAMMVPVPSGTTIFLVIVVSLIIAYVSILLFPGFQSFLEQRFLGIRLPYQHLQEVYSDRITTSTSLSSLLQLLYDEVFPSLLVRQFVFLRVSGNQLSKLLARDVPDGQMPRDETIVDLMSLSGKYLPASKDNDRVRSWIRLILPLKIGEDLIGLWLLGRRDPDDLYPQAEIPILQSLANQTAIALSNILQTERLRGLYRENINRYEQERLRLALELHDGVLNQMAVLSLSLDPSSTPVKFKETYDRLAQQLRGIVSDLRPPMLQYGLKAAFEELADNLMERSKDSVTVTIDVRVTEDRYPQDIEVHIFRIVQEASENALRHGHARLITISGQLDSRRIQLGIVDDGIGFEAGANLDLNSLLVEKHFGLAGIIERANLIGAELKIDSALNMGTQIRVALDIHQHGAGD